MPETSDSPLSAPYNGAHRQIHARLDALEGLRTDYAAFLRAHSVREDDLSNWQLVLTEAVVNAIKHGCADDPMANIGVSWQAAEGEVRLTVEDPGTGPAEELVCAPSLPRDPLSEHGRGLFLIRSFADDWRHWRSPAGYRLEVIKRHPSMPEPESTLDLLDNTVEELTNSYENLSAFYRLGDGLARAESLSDFLEQALGDLERTVGNAQLSISFKPDIVDALGADIEQMPAIRPQRELGQAQTEALRQEAEFIWERSEEVAEDLPLARFACGVCIPIQAGGNTRGLITVARQEARPFNTGELNTIRTFADILGIAVLNARNTVARSREARALRELEIASEIQKTLLPLPVVKPDPRWRLTTRREGAREVAGDYVGAVQSRNGDLHLVIVDVMGKGVSASFLAGMFRTAFTISLTFQYSPVGLMMALNRTLVAQLGDLTMFATCALARIPAGLDRIEIVNAGHCPAVLLREDGQVAQVSSSGPPLGLFADASYEAEMLHLHSGDKLFLVTDGLYEWYENGEAWGWEALVDFLAEQRSAPGEGVWGCLCDRMAHTSGGEPADDRTFLCWELLA